MARLSRLWPLLVMAAFVFSQSGCATHHLFGKDRRSREVLENRIEQLWQARTANDRKAIYALADHQYKEKVSLSDFLRKPNINVKKYKVVNVSTSENEAFAEVSFETERMGMMLNLKTRERWVFEKGAWYLDLNGITQQNPFGAIKF